LAYRHSLSPLKHPWRIVAFLAGAFVLNYVDRQVVFSIFPLLRSDLGFSDAQLGAAGTLFTWTYSLAMPFSGRLADVFPRGKLVMASLLLWSLATLATGLSASIGLFFASRIAMGLCESLYVPAAIGLIAQAHPGPTRSRALSIHGFAQYTGITLGGWYGGWAADHIGWRQGFAVLAALGVLYAGALMLSFRNIDFARTPAAERRGNAADLLHSRCYLTLCALFLSFCAMLWMLYAWLPVFVYERYGLSLTQSGLTATLYLQSSSAAGVLLGGVLGDALARRYPAGRFHVVIWGLLGCAPFALATFATHSLPLLKVSACGFGLFAGFLMANIFSALYDVSGPRNYGLATGVMNAIGGLGAGSAILAAGIWRSSVGIEPLMLGCLVLSMSCAVVLFFVLKHSSKRELPC
jgi:MFS transporter, Spinster family, sphingosine-1-phosphate transporter